MVQFNELLGNRSIVLILDLFFKNTTKQLTQSEIRTRSKIAKTTLIKWLKYLVKADLIKISRIGNSNLYKLNMDNSLIKELKKIKNLIDISPLKKSAINSNFYIYGSCARGEDTEKSDIDLLILGDARKQDIIKDIDFLSKKLNRKISAQIFTKRDWLDLYKKDKAFYERVERDKIII